MINPEGGNDLCDDCGCPMAAGADGYFCMDCLRDKLGRVVREAWVNYCIKTGDFKPTHVMPYDALDEWNKEADRVIGEAIARYTIKHQLSVD